MKFLSTSFLFIFLGTLVFPLNLEKVSAASNSEMVSATCEDMLSPRILRLQNVEAIENWRAENRSNTFLERASHLPRTTAITLWNDVRNSFLETLQAERQLHRTMFTTLCGTGGGSAQASLAVPLKFTTGEQSYKRPQKRMRVRRDVQSRTVGNTASAVITGTERMERIVQTGGRGVARQRKYLSVRERRKIFRSTAPRTGDCMGKKARLQCEEERQ